MAKRVCKRDGLPMVKIGERWECAGEYLERCVGGEKIVDWVVQEDTTYCIFESGHELPMLCPCCNKPFVFYDVEKTRKQMRGRRFKSATMGIAVNDYGEENLEFALEFSGKGLLRWGKTTLQMTSPQSVARMHHPEECPYFKRRR